MKSSKLPSDKRNKLILVAVGTLIAAAALYSFLISHQNENLARLAKKKLDVEATQQRMLEAIRRADVIENDLADTQKSLAEAEADIASGDLYSWIINNLRQFKANYKVNIPQVSSLGPVTEVTLIPSFPYKQTSLSLVGTAHFHDFGRFVADMENQFPHIRVSNMTLDLNPSPAPEDQETVTFKLDVVTLVKTNPS